MAHTSLVAPSAESSQFQSLIALTTAEGIVIYVPQVLLQLWQTQDRETVDLQVIIPTNCRAKIKAVDAAILHALRNPGLTDTEIAAAVGCHLSLLSRSDEYKRMRSALCGRTRRGHVDADGGVDGQVDERVE